MEMAEESADEAKSSSAIVSEDCFFSFTLGTLPRCGEGSSVFRSLACSPLFDPQLLRLINEFAKCDSFDWLTFQEDPRCFKGSGSSVGDVVFGGQGRHSYTVEIEPADDTGGAWIILGLVLGEKNSCDGHVGNSAGGFGLCVETSQMLDTYLSMDRGNRSEQSSFKTLKFPKGIFELCFDLKACSFWFIIDGTPFPKFFFPEDLKHVSVRPAFTCQNMSVKAIEIKRGIARKS